MIFISAGHNPKISIRTGKLDPGAIGCGKREADLAVIQRNLVITELQRFGAKFVTDADNESLGEYLQRIKTGNASVVCEFHFDAAANPAATGCTGIVEAEADRLDIAFAKELVNTTSSILGIRNRGVISEAQSHRGSLGLMREEGIICLLEIGFISNCNDIAKWEANKQALATNIARLLIKYENLIM
jgi:N-acetylmuramoyl-L-alanine amidase